MVNTLISVVALAQLLAVSAANKDCVQSANFVVDGNDCSVCGTHQQKEVRTVVEPAEGTGSCILEHKMTICPAMESCADCVDATADGSAPQCGGKAKEACGDDADGSQCRWSIYGSLRESRIKRKSAAISELYRRSKDTINKLLASMVSIVTGCSKDSTQQCTGTGDDKVCEFVVASCDRDKYQIQAYHGSYIKLLTTVISAAKRIYGMLDSLVLAIKREEALMAR